LLAPYLRKSGKFTVPEFIGGDRVLKARVMWLCCLLIISWVDFIIIR
jgi:Na+(H+)/acetate symporter ActP